MRRDSIGEYIKGSLWVVPTLFALGAVAAGQGAIWLDSALDGRELDLAFSGDADSARAILGTIATAMISFTGIVFTITIVALQLASQQFSPRILRTFFEDQLSQYSLGVFVASFVFALVVLRQVGSEANAVPRLSVSLAILLVLASMIVFVAYLDHMAKSIRISYIIVLIGDETRELIERFYVTYTGTELKTGDQTSPPSFVRATKPGILNEVHIERLQHVAATGAGTIEVLPNIGDFVATDGKLARVYGDLGPEVVRRHIDLGRERTMEQDVAFGIRQLVDISVKAISPAINDPTTAVQAIDQIHDLLKRLIDVPLPEQRIYGGVISLHGPTWDGLVDLALNEIRHFGVGYLQVARRVKALLEDLIQHSPADRHPVLRRQIELFEASVQRGFPDAHDREMAIIKDEQGLG